MDTTDLFEHVPFVDHLGIELLEAVDGHAEGRLDLRPELTSNPATGIAHGGVTYSLADTVGGAAAVSEYGTITPTIDMRIDYLAPATEDIYAVADVVKAGENVAVVEVDCYDDAEETAQVATARGVYKVSGQGEGTPWTDGLAVEDVETADLASLDPVDDVPTDDGDDDSTA
jgi:uncharacterized protein (TIGR00369 family)